MVAPAPAPTHVIGIDLSVHWLDIRRIFKRKFALKADRLGLDHDEFLQSIYERIARSNRGKHPFDSRKSSLGHYIFIVLDSSLQNEWVKLQAAKRKLEVVGMRDQSGTMVDVASWAADIVHEGDALSLMIAHEDGEYP